MYYSLITSVLSSFTLLNFLDTLVKSRKIFFTKYNITDLFNQDDDAVLSRLYFIQKKEPTSNFGLLSISKAALPCFSLITI